MKKLSILILAILVFSMILVSCQSENTDNPNANISDASTDNNIITKETAMLVSAGSQQISVKDVTFTSVALTDSIGANEYEVEFIYNGFKYKVDIDALTGNVNAVQKEEFVQADQSDTTVNDIGKDEAVKIALEKAGLADVPVNELSRLLVVLDRDDGRLEYDIDFIYNGYEYDISVSASDGTVLEFDKEREDVTENSIPDFNNSEYIGEEEAVAAALFHAKLTKAGIMGLRVSLERDDGRMKYEVEFYFVDTEYDYDIDAISGEIISFDRDAEHISIGEASIPDSNELISEQDAKKIALDHAGVAESDVYDFEIELDYDKGVMKYEIEFKSGGYEYEYDIGAINGKILQSNKELDD